MTRFEQYQEKIFEKSETKRLAQQEKYEKNNYSYYEDTSINVEKQINNSHDKRVASIKNLANSLPMLMAKEERFVQLSVTITFGYNRVADCRSFEEIEQCILRQASSGKEFHKKIRSSKLFRATNKSDCPMDKPYHYLSSVELQEEGDIHFHTVMYVKNNPTDILNMIKLIHDTRRRLCPYSQWSNIDCRRNRDPRCKRCKKYLNDPYYEVGRTHIGLSSGLKKVLMEYFTLRQVFDPKTGKEQFIIDDLNYGLFWNGQYTFIEFYDRQRLKETNRAFELYLIKMQTLGGDIRSAVYRSQTSHHLKSRIESATKYDKHKAIFSHLKIRLLQYSQSLFPVSLYQKLYPQLVKYDKRYKHLYNITFDLCDALVTIEKKGRKCVVLNKEGEVIAKE